MKKQMKGDRKGKDDDSVGAVEVVDVLRI